MKPDNYECDKQHAFDSFCKKVMRYEARDYYKVLKTRRKQEATFSDLSAKERGQLYTIDLYFDKEYIFHLAGQEVVVFGSLIGNALELLPEHQRNIILLSYYLGLSDTKIGKRLNLTRSTVQYQRTMSLNRLKELMEDYENGQK